MRVEPLTAHDPRRIGGYVLLGRLGAGAMGRVYLGRSAAGRLVAVKTIKSEFADEADFRARFAHEVTAARRVSGFFTAAVVSADPEADIPWLATAYVAAPSLDALVRTCGPLPVPALWWLAAGCAEALESIHQSGLVHRDLKPSNVLVCADGPRVIDFGVARAMERMTLTAIHHAVGTPAYMAPEQARDSRQTVPASDIFALGATLLFAATGHPPYPGDSVTDILLRLATEPPDLTGLPDEVTGLVGGCLERDPRARPSAAGLLAELAPLLEEPAGPGTGHGLPAAPLPARALELIEEHAREPRIPAPAGPPGGDGAPGGEGQDHEAGDVTIGSPTSAAPPDRPASPRRRGPLSRWPAGRVSGGPGAPRAALVAGAAAGAVAAALLGGAVGRMTGDRAHPQRYGPFPPPGSAPVARRYAYTTPRPAGNPRIALSQTFGDGNTGFVVHGNCWQPGQKIMVRLDGRPVSPVMPVVDFAGTFNYAINQNHEFYPAKIPPGRHRVAVHAFGRSSWLGAGFEVNRL